MRVIRGRAWGCNILRIYLLIRYGRHLQRKAKTTGGSWDEMTLYINGCAPIDNKILFVESAPAPSYRHALRGLKKIPKNQYVTCWMRYVVKMIGNLSNRVWLRYAGRLLVYWRYQQIRPLFTYILGLSHLFLRLVLPMECWRLQCWLFESRIYH